MAVNKTFKIPREILAQITQNNPQAIKAFENIEIKANEETQNFDDIVIKVDTATANAEQASIIATQAVAIINQYIDNLPDDVLYAVSVPLEPSDVLIPIQGAI